MATKLEAAAKAWRDLPAVIRGTILVETTSRARKAEVMRNAHDLAWAAVDDLLRAADVEPVTPRKRARKAAAKTKAARKTRALKAVRT